MLIYCRRTCGDVKRSNEAVSQCCHDESSSLAVEYAREVGAQVLVRGLRATEDYNYESLMCFTNQYLDNGIETVFLMTRLAYTFVSSSFVKEIVSHKHSVEGLVPACVEEKLIEKYRG